MMRLAAVACFIGLTAAGASAQPEEEKLVTVETLPPEPTVIMSGDLVRVTYRVRFPELMDAGKEVIILEDRMAPEDLALHPFEGVSLAIEKRRVPDGQVWDFAYDLRLIHPTKSGYIIPAFGIFWLVRDFGEAIEKAAVQQVETDPAPIRYVSTITDVGPLDIRDAIDLGEYRALASVWTAVAWFVSPLPLLLWILYVGKLARRPKPVSVKDRTAHELEQLEGRLPVPLAVGAAGRQLRRSVSQLRALAPDGDAPVRRAIERDLVIAIREYLHAELPELNPGDTAKDILRHVEAGVRPGARKDALRELATRMVVYQRSLEHGGPGPIPDALEEARLLDASLHRLRRHVRMWRRVTGGLRRGQ